MGIFSLQLNKTSFDGFLYSWPYLTSWKQDSDIDPAISYIIIYRRTKRNKPMLFKTETKQGGEEQKGETSEESWLNEPIIYDVRACCQNISILNITEQVIQEILKSDKNEIQITDLKLALLRFKIQDEDIKPC